LGGVFFLIFHYLIEFYEEGKEILAVLIIRLLLHLQKDWGWYIFSHRKHEVINLQKIQKASVSWMLVPRFNDDDANFSTVNYFMEMSRNVSVSW